MVPDLASYKKLEQRHEDRLRPRGRHPDQLVDEQRLHRLHRRWTARSSRWSATSCVDGEPVVGYGFNSNGRYSAGEILRRRVLPRLLEADADSLLDEAGGLSPTAAWDVMMRNEKPGGHGERSVAVGVVDMALHDLAAKVAGVPLYRWIVRPLRRRRARRLRVRLRRRRLLRPRQDAAATCRTRCAASSTRATRWSR